jgi:hypothetical protein
MLFDALQIVAREMVQLRLLVQVSVHLLELNGRSFLRQLI